MINEATTEGTMSIADIIRDQIGGRAFFMMGAKNLSTSGTDLTFKVGRGARGKGGTVTHIRVTLDEAADLYTIESLRCNVRAKEMVKVLEKIEGAYADMLHSVIADYTGMALSL